MTQTKVTPNEMNNAVQSMTHTGSGGGTLYYVNLGGIKMCWGVTGQLSVPANGNTAYTIVLPSGFFTTVQSATTQTASLGAVAEQYANVAGESTSSITGYLSNRIGATGTAAFERREIWALAL